MNKILFLDFDGVLNTEYYQGLLQYRGKPWQDEHGTLFDPYNLCHNLAEVPFCFALKWEI